MAKETARFGGTEKGGLMAMAESHIKADKQHLVLPDSSGKTVAPRKRRVQKRTAETTAKIQSAALRLFSERGYDAATIREIENAAGVKRGLVNHHFGNKEKLWKAVLQAIFGLLRKHLDARAEGLKDLPTAERAAHVIASYVRFNAAHPELTRLMVHESKRDTPRLRFIVDNYSRPLMSQLRESVGVLVSEDPEDFMFWYYTFLGASSLLYTMAPEAQLLFGFDRHNQDCVDRHADFVVDFLLNRRASSGPTTSKQPPAQKSDK